MVAYSGKLSPRCVNNPSTFTLNLIRTGSVSRKSPRDDDGVSVNFGFISIFSFILDSDSDFGLTYDSSIVSLPKIYSVSDTYF